MNEDEQDYDDVNEDEEDKANFHLSQICQISAHGINRDNNPIERKNTKHHPQNQHLGHLEDVMVGRQVS